MIANIYNLFTAETARIIREELSYWAQLLAGLVNDIIILFGLVFAIETISGSTDTDIACKVLIGLIFWFFAGSAIARTSYYINEERQLGTIERLFLSPYPVLMIFIFRAIGQIVVDIVVLSPIIVLFVLVKGIKLSADPAVVILTFILTLVGLYGFGFILSGMQILFRRISSLSSVLEYILLFFTGAIIGFETLHPALNILINILPLTPGITVMRLVFYNPIGLFDLFKQAEFLYLLANTTLYTVCGVWYFNYAIRKAKKRGDLVRY